MGACQINRIWRNIWQQQKLLSLYNAIHQCQLSWAFKSCVRYPSAKTIKWKLSSKFHCSRFPPFFFNITVRKSVCCREIKKPFITRNILMNFPNLPKFNVTKKFFAKISRSVRNLPEECVTFRERNEIPLFWRSASVVINLRKWINSQSVVYSFLAKEECMNHVTR